MSLEKLPKFLSRFIKVGLYLALLMPFIYVDNLVFPFITGKIFIFQILIEILAGLYLVLIYIDRNYLPRKSWLVILTSLYLLSWVISALFGVDADRSFWGNYERMSGVFTILHFFAFFFILGSMLRDKKSWYQYFTFALFLSGIEALIGIAQYFSTNLLLTAGGGKIWGTLGNYIYLATYSIFHIFIGAIVFANADAKFLPISARAQRLIFALLIFMNFITLYLSGTRGGYLGFFAGALLVSALVLLTYKNKRVRALAGALTVIFVALVPLSIVFRDSAFIKNAPILSRISTINFIGDTGFTRLIGWKIALKAWQEKPVFGWGPENYYYAFNKYFDPRSLERGYYETWFDRPHNIVLDVLSTQGALGLIIYASILLCVLVVLIKKFRQGEINAWNFVLPIGGLAAYFTQNLFVFDHPSSFLLFYLFLAWAHFISVGEGALNSLKVIKPVGRHLAYLIGIVFVLFLTVIYMGTIMPWRAGTTLIRAERAIGGDFEKGYRIYKDAVSFETPYRDDIQVSLARVIHERAYASYDFVNAEKEKIYFVIDQLEDHAKKHPNDVYSYLTLSQMYAIMAQVDASFYAKAEETIARGAITSPRRQQVYYVWARIKVMQGKYDEALDLIKKTIEFDPNIAEGYWYLGLIENTRGQKQAALDYLKEARVKKYPWKGHNEILLMASLTDELGNSQEVPPLLEEAALMSGQAEIYVMLANAYKKINKLDEAQRALVKALEIKPDLIKQLQANNK